MLAQSGCLQVGGKQNFLKTSNSFKITQKCFLVASNRISTQSCFFKKAFFQSNWNIFYNPGSRIKPIREPKQCVSPGMAIDFYIFCLIFSFYISVPCSFNIGLSIQLYLSIYLHLSIIIIYLMNISNIKELQALLYHTSIYPLFISQLFLTFCGICLKPFCIFMLTNHYSDLFS